MRMTIGFEEIDGILDRMIEKIFKGKDINSMSNIEKRKLIYDYIVNNNEYDFALLDDILSYRGRFYAEEFLAVLDDDKCPNKGKSVCNGFSYAYKLLLEKVGISSMLIFGQLQKQDISELENEGVNPNNVKRDESGKYLIDHMFILVKNDDGTFSFDDPTCAILDRSKGIDYFNYDLLGCKYRNQINMKGMSSEFLDAITERAEPTEEDKNIKYTYESSEDLGFLRLPDNIKKYEIQKGENLQVNR